MLDDETLRDGLQSPSVQTPTIEEKRSGSCTAWMRSGSTPRTSVCPAPAPGLRADVERLARAIGESRLKIRANCAARTVVADIRPIAEIQQRTGVPIECGAFIGSSPIRQYAEGWSLDYLQKCTEDAITFAVREGLTVMYVTEGHDAGGSRVAAPVVHRRGSRGAHSGSAVADTVGHSTPNGAPGGRHVREVARRGARRRRRHRLARAPRQRVWRPSEHRGAPGGRHAPARRGARHR